jgi:hypothetical protein
MKINDLDQNRFYRFAAVSLAAAVLINIKTARCCGIGVTQ